MRLGVKLDLGFSQSEVYRCLYGERPVLDCLRELGVEAVETPVGPETDGQALMEHVAICQGKGLRVSLHPYTEGTAYNPACYSAGPDNPCRELHEHFFDLAAEAARLQDGPTVVNIHSAAASIEHTRDDLVDQSVGFFQWAGRVCVPEVRPVAELQIRPNPDEPIQRIGDDYEELLEVVERSACGACWDFGHAVMNARRFDLPLDPPRALLSRFVHVHCHDVDRDDHQPLVFGNVPWRRFLDALGGIGFDGTVVLEVPPANLLAAGGLAALERSVEALRST
ncbi:MAG: sugar phosphate isomerase/epimerase family protein [Planctomycetota bacterium]|jgi:sugar phosphate isomerase/epimerase